MVVSNFDFRHAGNFVFRFGSILFDNNFMRNYNVIMKANIVQIGNSKGVRIPKTLLEQLQFEKSVEFQVLPEGLLLRPVQEPKKNESNPRENWNEMFQTALAETDDDGEDFADWNQVGPTEFDEKEW